MQLERHRQDEVTARWLEEHGAPALADLVRENRRRRIEREMAQARESHRIELRLSVGRGEVVS